ncbi:SCO3374 family protein [Streptomyces sp. NPDC087844]|uniref:SCO3374 family protein n=1 Tax=Streptomyces sp. NPDC087844 TaxID=3365805 RepID=UPI0038210ECC
MVSVVPFPRRPLGAVRPDDTVRHWYENELGWATVPGTPVHLLTGLRFDVLEAPAEAGYAALRHLGPGSPVAVRADRMWLFVAAGSAEELPGLLDWLEWGSLALDLGATGSGGRVEAPLPPGPARSGHRSPGEAGAGGPGAGEADADGADAGGAADPGGADQGRATGSQGAAVWLRPPEPGCEVESSLPTLSALGGGGGGAPDLVRLVETVASECHRIRLRRGCAQPLAFS